MTSTAPRRIDAARRLFLFASAQVLAACSAVGMDNIRRIPAGARVLPVSILGERMALRQAGDSVLRHRRRELDVSDWQVDDYAEKAVARLLATRSRFATVRAGPDTVRRHLGSTRVDFDSGEWRFGAGKAGMAALAGASGADYVLVVGPDPLAGDPYYDTTEAITGYGIYQREVRGERAGLVFLVARVVLFDGRTGAELASAYGPTNINRPAAYWLDVDAPVNLRDHRLVAARASLEELIDTTLAEHFEDLALVR